VRKLNIRKNALKNEKIPNGYFTSFAICAVLFAVGSVLGTIVAGLQDSTSDTFIYITSGELTENKTMADTFIRLAQYHILSFLLGFSILGIILIPALSCIRGFSLAFILSFLIRALKNQCFTGHYLCYIIFTLISVPLYLIVSLQSLYSSVSMLSALRGRGIFRARDMCISIGCFIILLLIAALESAIM
jgi:hypothetical protein